MSMTRYSRMKLSGEDWIGDIPQSWSAIRGKMLFEIRKRIAGEDGHTVLSITQRGVEEKDISSGEGQLAADYSKYQHLHRGEFAMNQMDLLTGWVDISKFDGVTSPDYRVFALRIPHAHDPRFHLYTLQHCYSQRIFFAFGKGAAQLGRWRLPTGAFNEFRFPNPPLNEQKAIARFLDRETAKIDELIAAQEDLIRLLKEKRQAVISHAVTKGLDPNAPMKPSGIEWLGDIPAHWDTKKGSWLFRAKKGREAQMLTQEYCAANSGPYPVYSGQTANEGVMGHLDRFEFSHENETVLLMTTVGAKAMTIRRISGEFSLSQNCMIIQFSTNETIPDFFYYHLQPLFERERNLIPNHMQPSFRMDDLYTFRVALPPIAEQQEIATFLDTLDQRFEALMSESLSAIELLKERRAALISAAVTGKIDVRGELELPEDEAIPA